MTEFILKSTLSLGLLYAVYIFLLEREKMHRFNRFYLILSLVFSLIIPFVTFEIMIESVAVGKQEILPTNVPVSQMIIKEKTNYVPAIILSIYGFITTILVIRFIINLLEIKQKINSNTTEKHQNSTLVLLNEVVLPHTFLNYVFINKDDYENRKIEDELFTHELTHVRQKHTLDILLIEVLKTIFWFNPMFILYKKAIQLNHEFLADEKVVKSHNNVPFYQNLLLEKVSWNNTFYLTSNLNFLITRKRLIMMTRKTSKIKALMLQLSVIPFAVALLLSCSTKMAVKPNIEGVSATTSKIETTAITHSEMDSLKKINPIVYANAVTSEYQKTKLTYLDSTGNVATVTNITKINHVEPPIILPKTPLDIYQISKIFSESVLDTDPDAIAVRAAHPEEFSNDPSVVYKATKLKFTLNDSTIVHKIAYQKITEN